MIDLSNPLTWPLFPVLPVVRIGGDGAHDPTALGIVGAARPARPVPVVFVGNMMSFSGRSLADIFADTAIARHEYESMEALARDWQPD